MTQGIDQLFFDDSVLDEVKTKEVVEGKVRKAVLMWWIVDTLWLLLWFSLIFFRTTGPSLDSELVMVFFLDKYQKQIWQICHNSAPSLPFTNVNMHIFYHFFPFLWVLGIWQWPSGSFFSICVGLTHFSPRPRPTVPCPNICAVAGG